MEDIPTQCNESLMEIHEKMRLNLYHLQCCIHKPLVQNANSNEWTIKICHVLFLFHPLSQWLPFLGSLYAILGRLPLILAHSTSQHQWWEIIGILSPTFLYAILGMLPLILAHPLIITPVCTTKTKPSEAKAISLHHLCVLLAPFVRCDHF